MRPLSELKKRIFERRIKQGWLAERLGISEAHLSMLMCGRRRLKAAYRRKIAAALKIPQATLFGCRVRRRAHNTSKDGDS
jgi:transcriptional regulator with XRE-family HTH domain